MQLLAQSFGVKDAAEENNDELSPINAARDRSSMPRLLVLPSRSSRYVHLPDDILKVYRSAEYLVLHL